MDVYDCEIGDEGWIGDSYGYDRVRCIKTAHHSDSEGYPFDLVEFEYLDRPGTTDKLGGMPGYAPMFYPRDW